MEFKEKIEDIINNEIDRLMKRRIWYENNSTNKDLRTRHDRIKEIDGAISELNYLSHLINIEP